MNNHKDGQFVNYINNETLQFAEKRKMQAYYLNQIIYDPLKSAPLKYLNRNLFIVISLKSACPKI